MSNNLRGNLHQLPRLRGRSTEAAFAVREQLKYFLNSPEGSVEWQEQAALAIYVYKLKIYCLNKFILFLMCRLNNNNNNATLLLNSINKLSLSSIPLHFH